jgi:parvulin-like peptidyl-prolyl isomerase
MKKHRSQCLAIAVSIATAAFALAENKPSAAKGPGGLPAELAATVNGDPITNAELEQTFARAAASRGMSVDAVPAEQKPGVLRMILDDMINERLVSKAAAEVKIEPAAVDAEFEKILVARKAGIEDVKKELAQAGMTVETLKADIAKRMQQRQWVDDQIKGKTADATEPEAKEFYEKNPQHFETPEQVRASHILFRLTPDASPEKVTETLKKAEAAAVRAKKEDFAKLAGELSEEPGAKERGGDLSFFPRKGAMVEPFAEAAFKLKKNEVSPEPVRSEFGYHIIKVTDRKAGGKQAFDEAKPQILAYLSRERKRIVIDEMIASMRQKADVKLNIAAPAAPAPVPTK